VSTFLLFILNVKPPKSKELGKKFLLLLRSPSSVDLAEDLEQLVEDGADFNVTNDVSE